MAVYFHLGICQLCCGSTRGELFSFRVESLGDILCWCCGICFLFSVSDMVTVYTNWETTDQTICVCTTATLQSIHMAGICASGVVCGPYRSAFSR